jgi:hypothetical protein
MLEGPAGTIAIFEAVEPYVSETIWIGKMQEIDQRVDMSDRDNAIAVDYILKFQSDDNILLLHKALNGKEKVRWKDSIREVIKQHSA